MAGPPRWLFWVRGSLLCALGGHWVANALLDRDQFASAGLEYTWHASLPILVQTILVLLVVAIAGSSARGRGGPARPVMLPRLLSLLVVSQLALFLLFEVSERLVQREPFSEGLLGSGFVLELAFAIGSALLLLILGSAAAGVIRSVRGPRPVGHPADRLDRIPDRAPIARPVVVVGGVRAPPLLPA